MCVLENSHSQNIYKVMKSTMNNSLINTYHTKVSKIHINKWLHSGNPHALSIDHNCSSNIQYNERRAWRKSTKRMKNQFFEIQGYPVLSGLNKWFASDVGEVC